MYQEEIQFQNNAVMLTGTLYLPDDSRLHPVLTVAHTASAGTRDFGAYRHLANVLPEEGVGVFVFDRRGSGSSGGNFETASFFDLASDIQAAITRLKLRPDVDVKNLGIWGMSQGGWIAPLAASQSVDVAFVIAVSAPAVSPAEQMDYSARFELYENGFSQDDITQMLALRALVNAYYRGTAELTVVQSVLDKFRDQAWFSLAYLDHTLPAVPGQSKWYQEMDYDPLPVMQSLKAPTLLLYGEIDPWVPVQDSITRWKEFGPADATIKEISDANHFMLTISESGIRGSEGLVAEGYTKCLMQWITQQLK